MNAAPILALTREFALMLSTLILALVLRVTKAAFVNTTLAFFLALVCLRSLLPVLPRYPPFVAGGICWNSTVVNRNFPAATCNVSPAPF
jgi:hypothetical protein